jgi:DNA-binding NtrC family response regulator
VRSLARRTLERQGYLVLESARPSQALRLSDSTVEPIHILVTDVVMPEMSGHELASQLEARRPGIKVLYMSGYTDDALGYHGVLDPDVAFLHKPFSPMDLARKVQELLEHG